MTRAVWKSRVDEALARLQRDRWSAPAVRYMEIIDDVAAGRGSASEIVRRAGSLDLVLSALDRITVSVHGEAPSPRLADGGWYEADGEHYRVAPGFAAEWRAARDSQRRMDARRSV